MDWTHYFDKDRGALPYESDKEYFDDCLSFISMLISAATELIQAPEDKAIYPRGIIPGEEKLNEALSSFTYEGLKRTPPEAMCRELLIADAHIKTRVAASAASRHPPLRLTELFFAYHMNGLERLSIILSLAAEKSSVMALHIARLQGGRERLRPTVSLCIGLYSLYCRASEAEQMRLRDGGSLIRRELFEESTHYDAPLFLRPALTDWLDGSPRLPEGLFGIARLLYTAGKDEPLLIRKSEFFGLCEFVRKKLRSPGQSPALVNLRGKEGSGRHFFLRHLVAEKVCTIISLSLPELCAMDEARRNDALNELSMIIRLSGCVLALEGAVSEDKERIAALTAERLLSVSLVLFCICEPEGGLKVPETAELLSLPFNLPSAPERLLLWEKLSASYELSPEVELSFFANTYKLFPGEISSVLRQASSEGDFARLSPPFKRKPAGIGKSELVALSSGRGTAKLSGLAERISPAFGWDDLILDEEQKDILRLACSRLNYAHKVGSDWGFDKTVVYGRGVSVLLYGPPGTGKTMAAQIMAAETGMELYRIDLSRLSSKYVGETEKNISRLFEEAKNLNIILFFDEADSLFSKRTEVTGSNDRFANAETAFILQQVEQYEGMCILATNLYKNFDSAFIRRISCAVKFSLPDASRRLMLWESIIPESAPVSPDLDLRFLADSFEMSGSEIKSVIYTAAYLAAEKNKPISMSHIIKALRIDFAKTGKLLSESQLGPYGE